MEIGIIGLGNAGKPIAERLLKKGRHLKVFDLNPAPMEDLAKVGAVKTHSAGEAVGDLTLIVLPSSIEVKSAALGDQGFLATLQPGSILVDLSGTDPGFARELEKKCDERNVDFLGATLHAAGAPAVTIPKGLLSVVIGGKEAALEKCLAVLKDLCQKIICVPEPWMPKAMKIAVIMFAATSSIVCAEVFSWLTAQGIDPKLFLRLLQTTGSRESAARVEEFLKRGKSYGGALSNSYKDIRQALETAAALELPLPLMNTVNQLQEMARAQGLTRLNTPAAIGKLYEILTTTDLSEATLESERVFPEPHEPQVFYLGKTAQNRTPV
jgi:3-hydroxyisobutyrate dehydrogenase-like beta-hydroxyacid dehydrogenase